MPQSFKTPEGKTVQFPDNMPIEEIRSIMKERFPPSSKSKKALPSKKRKTGGNQSALASLLDRAESGAGTLLQGATFGAGDEIQAALGTLPAYAIKKAQGEDISISDAYNLGLDFYRGRVDEARDKYPVQSLATEAAGGVLTGATGARMAKAAAPKSFSALSKFAATNPVKTTALGGAGSGAVYGFNEGEGGALSRLKTGGAGAGGGLVFGAGAGKLASKFGGQSSTSLSRAEDAGAPLMSRAGNALDTVKKNLSGGIRSKELPSSEGTRRAASQLYKESENIGGRLKPDATKKLLDDLSESVAPKDRVDKALSPENVVQRAMEELDALKEDGASFVELRSLEQKLGELAEDNVVAQTGKYNQKGNMFKQAQRKLRQSIADIDEDQFNGGKLAFDLKREADKKWGQSIKMQQVENVIQNAELQEQPSTALKSRFRTILSNPNKKRQYNPDELKAMKGAAELDLPTRTLRTIGSRAVPTLGSMVGFGTGGINPASVALSGGLYGASSLARYGANKMQMNKAQDLLRLLDNPNALNRTVDPNVVRGASNAAGITGYGPLRSASDNE